MKNNNILICAWLLIFCISPCAIAQKKDLKKYEQRIRDRVAFFEYLLNTLGNKKTSDDEREIIVSESYSKIFLDAEVQVEDDLDERRDVVIYKEIQAYLKDVDFFFQEVKFEYNIEKITPYDADGGTFFKVDLTRNLNGINIEGEPVNSVKDRFIEFNFGTDKELKIASIYTTTPDEEGALMDWWNELTYEWQGIFKKQLNLMDSATLDDVKRLLRTTEMSIAGNQYVIDIEPLNRFTNLTSLDISITEIDDLYPIRNLTGLKYLNVAKSGIDDLEPIRYINQLEEINLDHTLLSDLNTLSRLKNLHKVSLKGTQGLDLSPLGKLKHLRELDLSQSSVSDLSFLIGSDSLKKLNLANTQVSDIDPLAKIRTLEALNLEGAPVSQVKALSEIDNLRILNINSTQVSNLKDLDGLKQLQRISCDNTTIDKNEAQDFMQKHPGVLVIYKSEDLKNWWNGLSISWQKAMLRHVPVSNAPTNEELAKITKIDSINIAGEKEISSLNALQPFYSLKKIIADSTSVAVLSAVRNLKSLENISLINTEITSLDGLQDLTNLKYLNANGTDITSLDALEKISLEKLHLDQTPLSKNEIKRYLSKHPQALVIFRSQELQNWWADLDPAWRNSLTTFLDSDEAPRPEDLHRLTSRKSLIIKNQQIDNLEPVQQFMVLEEFRLQASSVTNLDALYSNDRLKVVEVSNAPLVNINLATAIPDIVEINISNTPVSDLSALENSPQLKKMDISGTKVTKLNDLKYLTQLEYLDFSNTMVKKLVINSEMMRDLKAFNTRVPAKSIEKFRAKYPDCEVTFY